MILGILLKVFIAETHAFVNRAFHRLDRALDRLFHERLLFFEKSAENVIDRAFARRGADSDAQARNLFGPETER